MLDITSKWNDIVISTKEKKEITFNTLSTIVKLDWLDVNFPWEYEKSEILLEVKQFEQKLIYKFHVEWYIVIILPAESFEKLEDILPFFGDIDLLILLGTKTSVKLYENIEAKIVVPYGEEKSIFLATLWQHKEEVETFRIKGEIAGDTTEFVFLK